MAVVLYQIDLRIVYGNLVKRPILRSYSLSLSTIRIKDEVLQDSMTNHDLYSSQPGGLPMFPNIANDVGILFRLGYSGHFNKGFECFGNESEYVLKTVTSID